MPWFLQHTPVPAVGQEMLLVSHLCQGFGVHLGARCLGTAACRGYRMRAGNAVRALFSHPVLMPPMIWGWRDARGDPHYQGMHPQATCCCPQPTASSPVRGRKPKLTALLSAEVGTSPLGYSLPSITASEGPYQQLVKSPGAAAASPRGGQWGAAGRAGEMKGTSRWWGLPGESWEDSRTQLFPERPWDRA